ncbi:Uncharacterised protein [Mycobacterium tuberculosis]|nr:Uncharacterised protein [Mycobacterium tuberculosis]
MTEQSGGAAVTRVAAVADTAHAADAAHPAGTSAAKQTDGVTAGTARPTVTGGANPTGPAGPAVAEQ